MNELAAAGFEPRIGVFTTDTNLVVKSWDATLERMTGIPAADACGRHLDVLVPDLSSRMPPEVFREPLLSGAAQVLAPALHKYLIPCAPIEPSAEFDRMQQRVVVGALRNDDGAVGLVVTVEDVTTRLEIERRLARQIREGSRSDRLAAIRNLAELGLSDANGHVDVLLADDDWQVRRAAVRAVAARRDEALVDSVITALRDGHRNFSLLSSALQLLSMTGVDVTDALVSLMHHDDADLRIQAALALGTQSRPEAVDALVAAFDDPDVNVRFHAIEAIGKLAHPAGIDRLAEIATSGDFFLAFPAIEALARINDPLVAPRLVNLLHDDLLGAATAELLGRIGDEDSVPALVQALDAPNVPIEAIVCALVRIHSRYQSLYAGAACIEDAVRLTATTSATGRIVNTLPRASGETLKCLVTALGWLRDPAIPPALARLLGSSDVRHDVTEALVRYGGSSLGLIVPQLEADDVDTRRAAVVALGRVGEVEATPALIKVLLANDQRDLWVATAGALARIGDRRAFEPLLSRLGDRDAAVRLAVIGALNSIGHPDMAARVGAMLAERDPFVRESAVRIAGYFGYPECVDAVVACCRDQDESVRSAALELLPYFDDARALDVLAAALAADTPRARASAAQALGALLDPPATQLLEQALADAEAWVRYFAAIGLGRHGSASAIGALADRVRSDAAGHVSVAAVDAIGAIGGEASQRALMALVELDDERGIAAIRALGRIRSDDAIDVFRSALRSEAVTRRMAAVDALTATASDAAVDTLAWTASADADPAVARAALSGLAAIAGKNAGTRGHAVGALVETLREPARRQDVVDTLSALSTCAVAELTRALAADDPVVRRGVVEALGRHSHPAATACLRRALGDGDAVVRRTAIMALSRIGSRGLGRQFTALAHSDPSPAVQQAAAAALHRRADAEGDE